MESSESVNLMLSSNKGSDFEVQLHPLVILTISDYVTRHTLRRQKGPIVGAIIGAQDGRQITMEHAFECKTEQTDAGQTVLDASWFHERLQQYKDVHKSPQLDLVGWFTLAPPSGPQPQHLAIHQQLLDSYNESALLLAFHANSVLEGTSKGGNLPLTIYETAFETSNDAADSHRQSSGDATSQLVLRFKELPYTIDTGEAEMIAVDVIAKSGTIATVSNGVAGATTSAKTTTKPKSKSSKSANEEVDADLDILSPEDEELIASLTTKANAIRMLQERISLTKAYINSIPPCYLNTPQSNNEPVTVTPDPQISHPILRSISSTLSRLPLLDPPPDEDLPAAPQRHTSTFASESAQQKSDVALVSLLGSLGSTLRVAQDMGKKASVVERARFQAHMHQNQFGAGAGKVKGGGSYALRSGYGQHYEGQDELSAYTPPMESGYGDEGFIDGDDMADGGAAGNGLAQLGGSGSGAALRGKGKGLSRDVRRRPDEDEEMT